MTADLHPGAPYAFRAFLPVGEIAYDFMLSGAFRTVRPPEETP